MQPVAVRNRICKFGDKNTWKPYLMPFSGIPSSDREHSYSDLLTDEEKAWEADQKLLLQNDFDKAKAALDRDDTPAAIEHFESAFRQMAEMKRRLERSPRLFPAACYEPHNEAFAAKQLCRLYLKAHRADDTLKLASRCYARAHNAFFQHAWFIPQAASDSSIGYSRVYGKYMLFKFWAEALGNFYVQDGQAYMAHHLWETVINDLKQVNWGEGDGEPNDRKLAEEQELWLRKLAQLRDEDV